MLEARVIPPPPKNTNTQGHVQGCRCMLCGSRDVDFPTTFSALQGSFLSTTEGHGGWNILQFQPSSGSPCGPDFPKSPVLNPTAQEGSLHSIVGHQASHGALSMGQSLMPGAARLFTFISPFHAEDYSPSRTTGPNWHIPKTSNSPRSINLEGHQMPLGCFSSSTSSEVTSPIYPNFAMDRQFYQASLYAPTGEIPQVIDDAPAKLSAPQGHTVRKLCGWTDEHGTMCNIAITYRCQHHFATVHGITKLSANTIITCRWCYSNIRRHCFLRHVREAHLKVPRLQRRAGA